MKTTTRPYARQMPLVREDLPLLSAMPKTRRCIELLLSGLSREAVAERMGIPLRHVSCLISEAKRKCGYRKRKYVLTVERKERYPEPPTNEPHCERCGLRGEHVCVGGIESFISTGISAIALAEDEAIGPLDGAYKKRYGGSGIIALRRKDRAA